MPSVAPATLVPGDVLLYRASSVYGRIIAIKTWHGISHCECFVGDNSSVASRDGIGTGTYPFRIAQLEIVCRPKPGSLDVSAALRWFARQPHRPYGWLDLLQFVGLNISSSGIVCSPFVTEFLRAGGLDPFNGEPPTKIAPFEFILADCFGLYDVDDQDGTLKARAGREVAHA